MPKLFSINKNFRRLNKELTTILSGHILVSMKQQCYSKQWIHTLRYHYFKTAPTYLQARGIPLHLWVHIVTVNHFHLWIFMKDTTPYKADTLQIWARMKKSYVCWEYTWCICKYTLHMHQLLCTWMQQTPHLTNNVNLSYVQHSSIGSSMSQLACWPSKH